MIVRRTMCSTCCSFRERTQGIDKIRKSCNISGVNSANLSRFKEFIYICTEQKHRHYDYKSHRG